MLALASLLLHAAALDWAKGKFALPSREDSPLRMMNADLVEAPHQTMPLPAAPLPAKPVVRKPRTTHPIPPAEPTFAPQIADGALTSAVSAPEDNVASAPPPAERRPAAPDVPDAQTLFDDANEHPVAASPLYQVHAPPSVDLKYDVLRVPKSGASMSGRGTISWRQHDGQYSIDGTINWLFITALTFKSEGMIDDYGVSPVIYSQKTFRHAETDTHFHRERNTISFSASENAYPRMGGEQDRASIIWQLAGIGRGDETLFSPGAEFKIMVAGVRDAEPWLFRVTGRESIDLAAGTIDTWHLVRVPKPGSYEQGLDIWLAPQHEWYPVKLRYSEPNGDHLDLSLAGMTQAAQN